MDYEKQALFYWGNGAKCKDEGNELEKQKIALARQKIHFSNFAKFNSQSKSYLKNYKIFKGCKTGCRSKFKACFKQNFFTENDVQNAFEW